MGRKKAKKAAFQGLKLNEMLCLISRYKQTRSLLWRVKVKQVKGMSVKANFQAFKTDELLCLICKGEFENVKKERNLNKETGEKQVCNIPDIYNRWQVRKGRMK